MRNKKAVWMIFTVTIAIFMVTLTISSIPSESSNTTVTADASLASKAKVKDVLQIEDAKPNLTDAQKKLSTDLLQLIGIYPLPKGYTNEALEMQMKRLGQFRPASSVSRKADGRAAGDLVYVYVYLQPSAGTRTFEPYVWEITDRDEENHLVVAWVEVEYLEALASLEAVRTIRTVMPPLVMTGSVTTEGDAVHRTADVRATYSQSGSGMKVGIISDGVDHWMDAQSSGDLPAVTVLSNTQGGDEGTAMLEIVHDVVPDSKLYFHDCGSNTVAFNAAINELVNAGCDIICDDIGWILEPFFEDGIIASHLTTVLASNDIIYASSAGNAGDEHYQGDYYPIPGSTQHDFSRGGITGYYLYLIMPAGSSVRIVLQWNDRFGYSGNDYDLGLYSFSLGDFVSISINTQDGDDDPLEWISYTATAATEGDFAIVVDKYSGVGKTLEVYIYPENGAGVYTNNINVSDSIFGHPAVPDAIAVGAVRYSNPNNIEFFSSQGPVTISYPSPVTRAKPDLCGVDGVLITGAGGFGSWDGSNYRFYGTSAAAPHIAAIAAQLWGAFPNETANEIRTILCSSAVDLGSAGYDNVYGYGRADALNAFSMTQPDIWVEPASFEVMLLQDATKDYMLKIGNDGNATLTYNITDNSSWLDEKPKSGSAEPDKYHEITVSIDTMGLELGNYSAKIVISNNDPGEDPTNVPVDLTVKAAKRWDINEDGTVNYLDLGMLATHWGESTTPPYPRWDINEDGNVNYLDLGMLAAHWGESY